MTGKILDERAVAEIEARANAANEVISALNHGTKRWRLSVPARPDSDPDLVISASLRDVDALCATVKHLLAERERAIKILSPDIPRTDLCDAARQIVFAHALEKGSAEKLQSQLEQLRAENTALRIEIKEKERSDFDWKQSRP